MTEPTDLHYLSLARLSGLLETREVSSVELTKALIARIERLDDEYRAFITPTFELALDMARAADAEIAAGRKRGALHGIPVALKDAYDTKAIRTTVCSRVLADRVPSEDAAAWEKLRDAGAVLLGKLECTEFCLGGPSDNGLVPHSRNPWNTDRYPGGSSSGAGVGLSAGLFPGALGSDTGGSVRIPAAFCGIVGIKPTYGLVSLRGLFPLSGSLDHAGPMARSSEDCALMLDIISGHDPRHPTSVVAAPPGATAALSDRLDGLRVGYVRGFAEEEGVGEEPRLATEAALQVFTELGAEVVDVELPSLWDFTVCNSVIMMSEAFAIHEEWLTSRAGDYSTLTKARISLGGFISATDYLEAQKMRRELAQATRRAMDEVDVLVYPGMIGDPPLAADVKPFYFLNTPLITAPANVSGVPAVSTRCGFSAAGMPMALQVTGRLFEDATVLRVSHAYERATPEFDRRAIA